MACWAWWADDHFKPYTKEVTQQLEAAFLAQGKKAQVVIETPGGAYVVKHNRNGWLQHQRGQPGRWRRVERNSPERSFKQECDSDLSDGSIQADAGFESAAIAHPTTHSCSTSVSNNSVVRPDVFSHREIQAIEAVDANESNGVAADDEASPSSEPLIMEMGSDLVEENIVEDNAPEHEGDDDPQSEADEAADDVARLIKRAPPSIRQSAEARKKLLSDLDFILRQSATECSQALARIEAVETATNHEERAFFMMILRERTSSLRDEERRDGVHGTLGCDGDETEVDWAETETDSEGEHNEKAKRQRRG